MYGSVAKGGGRGAGSVLQLEKRLCREGGRLDPCGRGTAGTGGAAEGKQRELEGLRRQERIGIFGVYSRQESWWCLIRGRVGVYSRHEYWWRLGRPDSGLNLYPRPTIVRSPQIVTGLKYLYCRVRVRVRVRAKVPILFMQCIRGPPNQRFVDLVAITRFPLLHITNGSIGTRCHIAFLTAISGDAKPCIT